MLSNELLKEFFYNFRRGFPGAIEPIFFQMPVYLFVKEPETQSPTFVETYSKTAEQLYARENLPFALQNRPRHHPINANDQFTLCFINPVDVHLEEAQTGSDFVLCVTTLEDALKTAVDNSQGVCIDLGGQSYVFSSISKTQMLSKYMAGQSPVERAFSKHMYDFADQFEWDVFLAEAVYSALQPLSGIFDLNMKIDFDPATEVSTFVITGSLAPTAIDSKDISKLFYDTVGDVRQILSGGKSREFERVEASYEHKPVIELPTKSDQLRSL